MVTRKMGKANDSEGMVPQTMQWGDGTGAICQWATDRGGELACVADGAHRRHAACLAHPKWSLSDVHGRRNDVGEGVLFLSTVIKREWRVAAGVFSKNKNALHSFSSSFVCVLFSSVQHRRT